MNADLDKASTDNERNAVHLRTASGRGRHRACRWRASSRGASSATWARATGSPAGQRYGFIRFGSRVDVYLPPGSTPKVAIGDKVSATSTVLAVLPGA